jgi:hypothetical protein
MAEYAIAGVGRDRVDAIVGRWKTECWLADDSVLFDDREVWTQANLENFRTRFLEHPILGTDQTFMA